MAVVSPTAQARLGAAVTAVAPALLLLGFAYHPYVANGTDESALADAAASDTTRWGVAHLAIGIGYALLAVAFIAVSRFLSELAEQRRSTWALPFAVLGCALFPILVGMEFALLAAAETDGDVESTQAELMPWFIPILALGAISFAIGAIGFAMAITRADALAKGLSRLAAAALVVMAVVRVVPLGASQIVIGVAAIAAFWPLAYAMWTSSAATSTRQLPTPTI